MKRIRNIIAISAFSMLVLALPSIASAQWNGGGYPNGGYPTGRNQGQYGQYGGYGMNLEQVANRLKDRSKDFERQVDREFNNNRNRNYGGGGILGAILNGGRNGTYGNRGYGNDQIKRLAEDFRRAANDFENRVDGNGRNNDYRGQEAANRMLSIGSQLDNQLRNMGYGSNLQYQWNAIRSDLSIVANAYGYNNGRGGRNGRNGQWPF